MNLNLAGYIDHKNHVIKDKNQVSAVKIEAVKVLSRWVRKFYIAMSRPVKLHR